jgi:hypothetical protein
LAVLLTVDRARPAPNWLVVSMITLPASDPAADSASSMTGQGTEKTTTSAAATASAGLAAEARGPISAASRSSDPGSRENETVTLCPAPAKKWATLPPMRPAPMMPTRTIALLGRVHRQDRLGSNY